MSEQKIKVRVPFVLSMTGAMIAYYIGASTGSGQEFFQAYGTHGVMGIVGVIILQILAGLLAFAIILTCQRYKLTDPKSCFIWFLGKYVGTAVYYYTAAFVLCTLVQLISGTGSIVSQYYGLPYFVGAFILTALLAVSVLFGFKRLIDVISKIAPFILIVMMVIAILSIIHPVDGIRAGSELIIASQDVYRTSPNWLTSTILHFTYLILFMVPYFISCYTVDVTATKKETILWITLSFTILGILCSLMITSQVANISLAIGSAAPNVAIATSQAPTLAVALVAMIMAASYTTTAPIALIAAEYFAKPDTKKYKIVGILILLIGLAISFAGSYAQIINVLVSVSGRIGVCVCVYAAGYRIFKHCFSPKENGVSTEKAL